MKSDTMLYGSILCVMFVSEEEGFGLSTTEIGGIIGGLTFLVVAVTLAVIAVVCNRRRSRKQRPAKYSKLYFLILVSNKPWQVAKFVFANNICST